MDRSVVSIAALTVAFALTSLAGCQSLRQHKWRGHGYGEEVNSLTENLRPAADEKQMTGFDQRARDIERNLGVR